MPQENETYREDRTCLTCKHAKQLIYPLDDTLRFECHHKLALVGTTQYYACDVMRNWSWKCGFGGRWWEAKE